MESLKIELDMLYMNIEHKKLHRTEEMRYLKLLPPHHYDNIQKQWV